EERGGVEDYCAIAARLLAPGGRFVVCAAAFQHARVLAGSAAATLAVTRTIEVVPRAGKAPLFSVYVLRHARESVRGHERGGIVAAERLVVRDGAGRWTPAFLALRAAMGMPPG